MSDGNKSQPDSKRSKKRWKRKNDGGRVNTVDTISNKSEKKLEKKYKKERTKSPHRFRGYDDQVLLPERPASAVTLASCYSSDQWWEPVDVGATTKEVPIEQGKKLTSLDVHDFYWRDTNKKEGRPKGFLPHSNSSISDGKPKGFLTFLETSLPSPKQPKQPKQPVAPLRVPPKSKGFLQFLENLGDRKRQKRVSTSLPNNSQIDIGDFGKKSSIDLNDTLSPITSPKLPAKDLSYLVKLGGILPEDSLISESEESSSKNDRNSSVEDSTNSNQNNIKIIDNTFPILEFDDSSTTSEKLENKSSSSSNYPQILKSSTKNEDLDQSYQGRDWNSEFQYLMEGLFDNEENIEKLRDLCEAFATVAKEIGTIIISELFLPPHERTIPPVTSTVGGVAGGEKYVYEPDRIFFKFAVDDRGIYGGTEYIMKVCYVK